MRGRKRHHKRRAGSHKERRVERWLYLRFWGDLEKHRATFTWNEADRQGKA